MSKELLDKRPTEGGSMDKEPEENTEKLFKQTGIRFGKLIDLKIELNLARGIEGNKKNYYRYVSDKRKTGGKRATPDGSGRCGYLADGRRLRYSMNFFFCLSLDWQVLQPHQPSRRKQRQGLENEQPPAVGEDRFKDL